MADSAASLSVQGLLSMCVNGRFFFCCCFFKKKKKLHVRHSWRGNNLYLKGVFECNLMEWKPQYLFEYTNSTLQLNSDYHFFIFIWIFFSFAFFLSRVVSRISFFSCRFVWKSETQAGCSSVVGFFLLLLICCVSFCGVGASAVWSVAGLLCVCCYCFPDGHGAAEVKNRGSLFFF